VPRDTRVAALQRIEKARGSRVLTIVLGDRQGMETRVAADLIPLASRHLRLIGKQPKLDLFLYTLGGDVMSAFRLVGLIREYCNEFTLLVPFRCQSAGTLVALGADRIIMLPEGQLSPVDPSTNGPYNPLVHGMPIQPGAPLPTLPVSVEEVIGYLSLAREAADIKGEDGMVSVFEKLASDVRPVALGQVFRSRTQIRMLSRKLLQFHTKGDDPTVDGIIETLTEKLYSHDYLITRREAKSIGLKVEEPESKLEQALVDLLQQYEADLELRAPFNPLAALATTNPYPFKLDRAYIESAGRLDGFQTEGRAALAPQGVQMQVIREGWTQL